MKLLDLELLVVSLRAQAGVSANPDVTFYLPRAEFDKPVGEKESDHFIEVDIVDDGDLAQTVWNHKVVASPSDVRSQKGDYNIPVHRINFYK